MKNYLKQIAFTGMLLLIITVSKSQNATAPVMPMDSTTKLITYTAVKEMKGVSKEELYKRAMKWFKTFYKNPTDVIREQDTVNLKIVGKARFKIYSDLNSLPKGDGGLAMYTITVGCREGRFKYEITAINWIQQSYYGAERWMNKESATYKPVYDSYLTQVDETIRDVVNKLATGMNQPSEVKSTKDNW